MKKRFYILALSLLASLHACGGGSDPAPPAEMPLSYETARKTWSDAAITDYQFTLTQDCFCLARGPFRVQVKEGKVQSAVVLATQTPVDSTELSRLPTLSALLDLVDEARQRHAASIQEKYNATYGYPERVYIDYDKNLADGERGYSVTDFSR